MTPKSLKKGQMDLLQRIGWTARVLVVSGMVILIALLGATGRPFIYFQF